MAASKAGGRQHGVKGRIVGPAVRDNGLKAGAHTADLYSARRYVSSLMACLDSLCSLDMPPAPLGADQVGPSHGHGQAGGAMSTAQAQELESRRWNLVDDTNAS